MANLIVDRDYAELISDLKAKVKSAQLRAHRAVNTELIKLYWSIGKQLLERQKLEKWGSKYLEQVSLDLKAEFPNSTGFSTRNLIRMRQFANLFQAEITPQAVAQLPWGHISELIQRVKDKSTREWYAQQALEQGWSRNVLIFMAKNISRMPSQSSALFGSAPPSRSPHALSMSFKRMTLRNPKYPPVSKILRI